MTPAPLTLRAGTPSDAPLIASIMVASRWTWSPELLGEHDLDLTWWGERWTRYLTTGSTAQFSRGDGSVLLAEADQEPCGFIAWHHTSRHACEAELQSIYVIPRVMRLGIGTRLLRAAASRLVAEGTRSMCVGYAPRNPFKRFYSKHGAVEIDPHWAVWRALGPLAEGEAPDR